MSMTRQEAHNLVDQLFDSLESEAIPQADIAAKEAPERVLPEGKRVVRTKSSGDRVYYIDEEKKTRQWVSKPEILDALGFIMEDVVEVEDSKLLKYTMASPLYKVDNA